MMGDLVRRAILKKAIEVCEAEYLDCLDKDDAEPSDIAYNQAVADCIAAIHTLREGNYN